MEKMAHQGSFDIETADDFFREIVLPEYDEFLEANSSARHALLCIMVAYHMYEWVYHTEFSKSDFLQSKRGQNEIGDYLDVARKVTNATKHFKNRARTRTQLGFSSEFSDEFARPLLVEIDNGDEVSVDILLRRLVEFWKEQKALGTF
jgi:hypothetical protein